MLRANSSKTNTMPEPSSGISYELGARASDSEMSSDPLRTSSESESSSFEEDSTAGPFGNGVYFRCALLDDGGELQVRLSPVKMSLFHSTCELNDLSGKMIAIMKTESTGYAKLSRLIGGVLTSVLFKKIADMAVEKVKGKIETARYINEKLEEVVTSVYSETDSIVKGSGPGMKKKIFKALTAIKDTAGGVSGTIGATLGGVAALALTTRRPVSTYSDAKKQVMLTGRFSKTRDAFVIRYTDREDIEAVPMMFVLKINKETKTWELHVERTDEDRLRIQVIKQQMEDDAKSAETDAAHALAQRKKESVAMAKNVEKPVPKIKRETIIDLGAGNAPPTSSSADLNFIGSDASVIDMDKVFVDENPKVQRADQEDPFGTPQPDETKLDAIRLDWAESTVSEMSIPAKWRRGATFGTAAGDFKHEVEKFDRVSVPLFGKRYAITLFGTSESHRLSFNGNGRVPRDVLAFCSYLVRTTNTVSLDLLFIIAALTNLPAVILLICNGVYKILKDSPEIAKSTNPSVNPSQDGSDNDKTPDASK